MPKLFLPFKTDISGIKLPEKFTFPFYYTPHQLAKIAAKELQNYIENQEEWVHNFGLNNEKGLAIGKMFGVLVCKNTKEELGQLWAFSGKLANKNHWSHFVPTVFDMLQKDSFFKKEEAILNKFNAEIDKIQSSTEFISAKAKLQRLTDEAEQDIQKQKSKIKKLKKERDQKRKKAVADLTTEKFKILNFELSEQSKKESILLKKMNKYWRLTLEKAQREVRVFEDKITELKSTRKKKSAALQQKLFAEYSFLNRNKEKKSLAELFDENPPAGAGECAAPKLLQYAFKHNLQPICMAEFWWGTSPNAEIRKHKTFYPACNSKCKPILMDHMLKGIPMDTNYLEVNPAQGKTLKVIYEDEVMLVINKPAEFLSVPGKRIKDSVYARFKNLYPKATGPLIVHRLDMSTSGLMLVAKNEETYVALQKQFINRTVKKRYVALLDGIVKQSKGEINLPLRVDLEDRPRQLVCYEHGKNAVTHFKVIKIINKKTLIYFYPLTGRTHQLRVHAAHKSGLNTPIVGDDLYGQKADRLHLHAEKIKFTHPVSKENMVFCVDADF